MTTSEDTAAPAAGARDDRGGRWLRGLLGALAGLMAAGVALGVAELVAGLLGPRSSPVVAVGNAAIPLTPEPVKEFAIRQFGAHDKTVLVGGVFVVTALYALLVGLVALRSRLLGALGVVVFGVVGVVAAATRPAGGPLDGLPSLVGAAVGVVALLGLTAPLTRARAVVPADEGPAASVRTAEQPLAERIPTFLGSGDRTGMDRRRFFLASAIAVGAAVVAGSSSAGSPSPTSGPPSYCRAPPRPRRPCRPGRTSRRRSPG